METYPDLHGHLVRIVKLNDFVITETQYEPGIQLQTHSHRNSFLSFVLEGGYIEQLGYHSDQCGMGTVIFHPAGETHRDSFYQSPSRCLNLHFESNQFLAESNIYFNQRKQYGSQLLNSLFRKLHRELRFTDRHTSLVLEGIGLEVLGYASRIKEESAFPGWLQKTIAKISESFHERPTIAELSREARVHPVHLIRTFHRFCGCTPGEWIRRLRIDQACNQLILTNVPLSEIALACGFADQSTFTKAFQMATGYTPARFRKMHKS